MSTMTLDTKAVRRWKRYPEYRACVTDTVYEAPLHWELKPLKYVITFQRGHDLPIDDRVEGDIPVVTSAGNSGRHNRAIAKSPGIVTGRYGTIGTFHLIEQDYWPLNTTLYSIDLHGNLPKFLWYMLHQLAAVFLLHSSKSAVPGVDRNDVHPTPVVLPPLSEQRAITAFLDRETARIDALIGHKGRLIALLEEKRQAVISHAVTRGLDPAALLKDSGIPWLGMVPMQWTVRRLKFLLSTPIEQGWSPVCDNRAASDEEWAVLKVGCVNGQEFDSSEHKTLPQETPPEERYLVRQDDILMSRGNTRELVGNAALVRNVRPRLLLSDLLYRFQLDGRKALSEFVVRSLRSSLIRYQIELAADGSSPSMKKIGQQDIRELAILLPPMNEQVAIVRWVGSMSEHIDQVVSRTRDGIARLQEYRTALISAAVTGQIDVRGEVQYQAKEVQP